MHIALFRSNNIFDSRVNKYVNYYRRAGLSYTIVGWDRANEGVEREHYDFYRYAAGVAVGGFQAIKNHCHWMSFIYRYLKSHREITTVHACDLNSAFPAACFKKLVNPDLTLIFDACDWYSAHFAGNKWLRFLFEKMEKFAYKWSDELIICEPERKAQVTFPLLKEPLVMPNIPEIDESELSGNDERYAFSNGWPVLAYFGGLVDDRFLAELIECAKTEPFNLLIGGYGSAHILGKLKEVEALPNVRFFGRMSMKDGLEMSKCADAIYAMYCKTNSNHIYAAPNKYYEAMLLGKPLITTKGTILEDKVVRNDTGYAIEESVDELKALIRSLDREDMQKKGDHAYRLWEDRYKDYIHSFFDHEYSRVIK